MQKKNKKKGGQIYQLLNLMRRRGRFRRYFGKLKITQRNEIGFLALRMNSGDANHVLSRCVSLSQAKRTTMGKLNFFYCLEISLKDLEPLKIYQTLNKDECGGNGMCVCVCVSGGSGGGSCEFVKLEKGRNKSRSRHKSSHNAEKLLGFFFKLCSRDLGFLPYYSIRMSPLISPKLL